MVRRSREPLHRQVRRRSAAQQGYVLVLTALLLLPLMAVTGLAVDLGAWYARAAQMQRAADAAALAGVVHLPDYARAAEVAEEVAADNGFVDGDDISVDVYQVTGNNARLQVSITDRNADQFFSQIFIGDVDITRASTAEYVKPVPMGSPKNFLGTGDTMSSTNRENFWLAMSGGCSSKEQGDLIATRTDANFTSPNNPPTNSSWASCTGGNTVPNANYSEDGYFYAVEFPRALTGSAVIEIYDAALCSNNSSTGDSAGAFTTTYTLRDNSSFNPRATNVIRSRSYSSSDCNSTQSRWVELDTIVNPDEGIYFVQVQTSSGAGSQSQMGSNAFGLRARTTSTFQACTSVSGETGYSASCPNVYGVEHMGVLASLNGTQPSFYLADIGPEHNNKTLEISLWDPGEGSQKLEILNPAGNPVNFTWEVLCRNGSSASGGSCPGETAPTGGYGPTTTNALDLGSANTNYPQPGPYRLSTSKYSDRHLKLSVELPDDINAAYGGLTWWRIRYTVGSAPTDRTTWSVAVKGDPVRLVPNP